MNRQEFEHIVKACANATEGREFLIIGSQSILGSVPDAPRELRVSIELDVCPLPFTEAAAAIIDGNIGDTNVEIRPTMEDRLKLVLSKLERRKGSRPSTKPR